MIILLLLLSYLFGHIATIGSPGIFIYGGFILFFVYAFTELMDRHPYSWAWELARNLYGLGILFYFGDWFGMNNYFAAGNYIFIGYFAISAGITFYFSIKDKGEERDERAMAA
jgi:hypothetical protein